MVFSFISIFGIISLRKINEEKLLDYKVIKLLCVHGEYRWTEHILKRMAQRSISRDDVKYALLSGEIIEEYRDDYPYPSCLIHGFTEDNQSLHIVCGISENELWMITTYYPNLDDWNVGYLTRKEAK